MNSRDSILNDVLNSQPAFAPLPQVARFGNEDANLDEKFIATLSAIGGRGVKVLGWNDLKKDIKKVFPEGKRLVTVIPEVNDGQFERLAAGVAPHSLENVYLALLPAHFAVAENGAVWLTEELIGYRVLPFICEHLALVVRSSDILPTMHQAYEKIGAGNYGFGTFVAGPSKTADIEQSLVLGAHGPRSMTVYLIG